MEGASLCNRVEARLCRPCGTRFPLLYRPGTHVPSCSAAARLGTLFNAKLWHSLRIWVGPRLFTLVSHPYSHVSQKRRDVGHPSESQIPRSVTPPSQNRAWRGPDPLGMTRLWGDQPFGTQCLLAESAAARLETFFLC